MDFEVEELSTPLDSQVIVWKLELPVAPEGVAKTEGAMRIYTTQRDFVGLAPLVMVSCPPASLLINGKIQQPAEERFQRLLCCRLKIPRNALCRRPTLNALCAGLFCKWLLF